MCYSRQLVRIRIRRPPVRTLTWKSYAVPCKAGSASLPKVSLKYIFFIPEHFSLRPALDEILLCEKGVSAVQLQIPL